ncbi:hypothetical protein BTO32_08265 [Marinobacter lutaoensis]|uniref:Uncharacterized protein n=1 Tax=Marinobacter lutaoensis TaxID=135739 RepID=A0A1V2DU76_9GAMM|nr:hypothetical protein BTO32_08265 [Marinobacter lutaoensis]
MNAVGWIRRKTEAWLDVQGGDWLFGAEFALMFLSLFGLMMVFALLVTLDAYLDDGTMTWIPLSVVGGMNLLITAPWGLYLHFLGNKAIKESPPVRFHRQRREVAMPRWTEGQAFKLPLWNDTVAGFTYIGVLFTVGWALTPFMNEYSSTEYRNSLVLDGLVLLGIELLVIGTYLFIALRLKKKHDPKLVYEIYPWDKLVAYIETKHNIGPGLMAAHTVLTLAIPKPDDPDGPLQGQMPPGPQRDVPVTLAGQEGGRLVLPAISGPHHHRAPHQDPGAEAPARGTESLVRAFAQGTVGPAIRGTAEPESTAHPCLRAGLALYPDGSRV